MSLRPPQSLAGGHRPETGANVLDYEIAQQKAEALGDTGRKVEQALETLRAFDARHEADRDAGQRTRLLDDAAQKVWAFMVQRELCGLRHWEAVVKSYAIPREVLNRMGRTSR
ncbi:DUF6665 family protein [Alsobacter sp. KACC 23698]|uniref:DUF6665 family protein n=1 Tax=Alsobacter sp. KACC 23698 TaxID=3149229 RepID=A0AAU7JLH6_9HYPH